ncbi:hydroxyphenylacetyl-CoA thioesterase PaaI [Mycobacterium hodleri]|uniref:Hydroxyphenylacetyl-CoA thioesterase PaaI n=1 Tax=Mycolicibacterium hodleri TaxID=49897 RepID=A0A544VWF7_9MYCO|nr:hydroxyphenylacetyl-CoA thioesterase PaaI [Mycolicibacterium hodleri]TQR84310.1 hydroxyphenylacetyl-CoA thioesterase PaaI [Mycolicibacterium hodleri]
MDTEMTSEGVAFAKQMLADDHAAEAMGIRLVRAGIGSATLAMAVTASMVNGHRMTHGGFVFALADTAFAVACNSYGRTTVASGGAITYLESTALGDELIAEAVERTRRGRSGVYDVTVRRGDDVVAEFRGNSREVRPRA